MKKMIFVVIIFVSFALFADETNWISYDGWVTGPGSGDNKYTYLLPFGYMQDGKIYGDDRPLLYETDMGWPVPNDDETELKYLFFGDTKFFMRDECGRIMSKITDGNDDDDTLLDFNIDEDVVDDSDLNSHFESCDDEASAAEITWENNLSALATTPHSNMICFHDCLKNNKSANCYVYCNMTNENNNIDSDIFISNYSECMSYCNDPDHSYFLSYLDLVDIADNEEKCQNFCKFDMVESYVSRGYFLYDGQNYLKYNNGTSNLFLAAELDDSVGTGNETQYKVLFRNMQNTRETGLNSPQVYSTANDTARKSKSIWMNSYERGINGFVGIYPRGYLYVCRGNPGDSCQQGSKKLFVPYNSSNWNFFSPAIFGENFRKHFEITAAQFIIAGSNLDQELANQLIALDHLPIYSLEQGFADQSQSLGVGIYDFAEECRIGFADVPGNQFPSCSKQHLSFENNCDFSEYPNEHVLWPLYSKMSNVTVIHGIDRDILSPNDGKEYIYFIGTGETKVDLSLFYIIGTKQADGNYIYESHIKNGYTTEDIVKKTQKAYVARVQNYEREIMCPSSYEYFSGISNGIARWTKNMDDAEPLYGF